MIMNLTFQNIYSVMSSNHAQALTRVDIFWNLATLSMKAFYQESREFSAYRML